MHENLKWPFPSAKEGGNDTLIFQKKKREVAQIHADRFHDGRRTTKSGIPYLRKDLGGDKNLATSRGAKRHAIAFSSGMGMSVCFSMSSATTSGG